MRAGYSGSPDSSFISPFLLPDSVHWLQYEHCTQLWTSSSHWQMGTPLGKCSTGVGFFLKIQLDLFNLQTRVIMAFIHFLKIFSVREQARDTISAYGDLGKTLKCYSLLHVQHFEIQKVVTLIISFKITGLGKVLTLVKKTHSV